MQRDENGHREYTLVTKVRMDSTLDGPALALQTPGLPTPGSTWAFDNDFDPWAFCKQNATLKRVDSNNNEPGLWWTVEQRFSTKGDERRCKDLQIDDPLLEPQKINGSFTKYQEEATEDRFGRRIVNSAWEQLRGPQVEFDGTRYSITVEQSVALLELPLVDSMKDCVNQYTLWGFAPRKVKLTGFTWERKFHFLCNVYYTRKFEFEARNEGWDRDILDEGTKVLHGHWDKKTGNWIIDQVGGQPPNVLNPQHFDRFKDRNGENARVILNGFGLPAGVSFGTGTFHGTYVCISEAKGIPPTDDEFWAPYDGSAPSLWNANTLYNRGDSVNVGDDESLYSTYLALFPNANDDPTQESGAWMQIATGQPFAGSNPFNNRGAYSVSTVYNPADYVTYSTVINPYGPGTVHIEKYGEADFLALGIPTDLGT